MRTHLAKPAIQFVVVIDAFIVATLVAKLASAGWGEAAGIGQIVFAATLVAVMLLAPRPAH